MLGKAVKKCKDIAEIVQNILREYSLHVMLRAVGGVAMLQKFKVQNFKNFRDELVWDFSNTKSYEFHQNLVP